MQRFPWVRGRVPNSYWSRRVNRVRYMVWLGNRLRFTRKTDWYGLTRQHFLDHCGGGLLATAFNHSPLAALRDYAPRYDWKPWLLTKTPQRYWADPENRRIYMRWLGQQLGYKKPSDWYALRKHHFVTHHGEGMLSNYHRNSPIDAVKELFPKTKWKEWLFHEVPQGFWRRAENRHRYLTWLRGRLRIRETEDWYRLTRAKLSKYRGATLLQNGYSPLKLLREHMPDHDWEPWRFERVPNGFWHSRSNRAWFLAWLGDYFGFDHLNDWSELTRQDIRDAGGGTLLTHHYGNSLTRFIRDARRVYQPPPSRRAA